MGGASADEDSGDPSPFSSVASSLSFRAFGLEGSQVLGFRFVAQRFAGSFHRPQHSAAAGARSKALHRSTPPRQDSQPSAPPNGDLAGDQAWVQKVV